MSTISGWVRLSLQQLLWMRLRCVYVSDGSSLTKRLDCAVLFMISLLCSLASSPFWLVSGVGKNIEKKKKKNLTFSSQKMDSLFVLVFCWRLTALAFLWSKASSSPPPRSEKSNSVFIEVQWKELSFGGGVLSLCRCEFLLKMWMTLNRCLVFWS